MSVSDYVLVFADGGKRDEVLLIHKDRPLWQKGRLNLPGGKIEEGEYRCQAALRELEEETGYLGRNPEVLGVMLCNEFKIFCVHCMVDPSIPLKPREGETEVPEWFAMDTIFKNKSLMPNLQILIPLMKCKIMGFTLRDDSGGIGIKEHTIPVTIHGDWTL